MSSNAPRSETLPLHRGDFIADIERVLAAAPEVAKAARQQIYRG